jgi:hypothetical protein
MATPFFPEMVSPLAQSNAVQLRTHIPRRNRKRSDGAVAAVRSVAAAIRVLANWSSFDNPFRASDCGLARFIPALWPCAFTFPLTRSLCWPNWDSGICDSHHVLEPLPLNQSLSLDHPSTGFGRTTRSRQIQKIARAAPLNTRDVKNQTARFQSPRTLVVSRDSEPSVFPKIPRRNFGEMASATRPRLQKSVNKSGGLAIFTAIRRASSRVGSLAAD